MFFEIEGKEYELKLTYKAISEINKKYKGGAQEIVSVAMLGDLEIFEDAIYYGLLHTEQGFTREKIQVALEKLMEKQVLTQEYIKKVIQEVITDHFFYQATAQKMKAKMLQKVEKENPDSKEMMEDLLV